ncbi:hypothetical protein LP417_13885 [Polaromonas sp. P1-6]|nr:hypothetical protein LP417_13885 [Polaromonas sp. P1-6]
MTVIDEHHRGAGPIRARTLAQLVHKQLGISVHPRSIEARSRGKKPLKHQRDVNPSHLPMNAAHAYETLRGQVLQGQARPDGLGAIVFHGMWGGLVVLLGTTPSPSISSPVVPDVNPAPAAHDPQLVRLLANMLLLTQSKDEYAY